MAILFSGASFYGRMTEIVGYKCGLALTHAEMREHLKGLGWESYAKVEDEGFLRIHSSECEGIINDLLKSFGRLSADYDKHFSIAIWHQIEDDPERGPIWYPILGMYNDHTTKLIDQARATRSKSLDPTELMEAVHRQYGIVGIELLMRIIRGTNTVIEANPWGTSRQVEWSNQLELSTLFKSEKLDVAYGKFLDQRFIDFLYRNQEALDHMHWRQFEHLAGEFLDREGYKVEMGPGRGDDGVDVRAWDLKDPAKPLILVQCKRQREAVPKVVVKGLYADILHEQAASGLLVTTSRIAPGAEDTRTARAYPIEVVDRQKLRTWLEVLRQPGVGE